MIDRNRPKLNEGYSEGYDNGVSDTMDRVEKVINNYLKETYCSFCHFIEECKNHKDYNDFVCIERDMLEELKSKIKGE